MPSLSTKRGLSFAAALSLSLLGSCERAAPPPQPTPQKAPDVPSSQLKTPAKSKAPIVIEYDLPIRCPPGQEFIKAEDVTHFSPEQLLIINSAHYLWKKAVGSEGERRARLAALIPVAPPLENMPPNHPFFGVIRETIAPMELKAAYVAGEITTEERSTKQTQTQPFRLFTFSGISASDSFFATVGSLGHEFQHAVQGEHEVNNPLKRSPKETFRRELEAYGREVQDLLLVSEFLKTSPEIDPALRVKNLDAWLTDIAGAIHHSGYYSFRFKLQYLAASISSGLSGIEKHLGYPDGSQPIATFKGELAPLLEYQRTIHIDQKNIHKVAGDIREFLNSQPALLEKANPEDRKKTESFLETVRLLEEAVAEVEAAEKRKSDWEKDPKPLQ
jgi:hypothetical protein